MRMLMVDVLPIPGLDSMANKPSPMSSPTSNDAAQMRADQSSDEQLMTAFSRGSGEAFTELFAQYRQPLFGYFWRRVADRAQAEELTQETFVAAIRAASRYEPGQGFEPICMRLRSTCCAVIAGKRRSALRFGVCRRNMKSPRPNPASTSRC